MDYLLALILGLVGWFILMLLTTNILGMVVRGFFIPKEGAINPNEHLVTIIFFVIGIVLFYIIFKYIGLGAFIASILLVIARMPDLLWEIKHGKSIAEKRDKNALDYLLVSLSWIALPLTIVNAYILVS